LDKTLVQVEHRFYYPLKVERGFTIQEIKEIGGANGREGNNPRGAGGKARGD